MREQRGKANLNMNREIEKIVDLMASLKDLMKFENAVTKLDVQMQLLKIMYSIADDLKIGADVSNRAKKRIPTSENVRHDLNRIDTINFSKQTKNPYLAELKHNYDMLRSFDKKKPILNKRR